MNFPFRFYIPDSLSLAPRGLSLKGQNMIAIASGKGGVGKTWLSVSMAHALTMQGKKVLLFDGDLGMANVDIQLGLLSSYDLASVFSGKVALSQAISHSSLGFDIIAGHSGSGALANVPMNRLQLIFNDLQLLACPYDKVIIDLGAGIEKAVRLFAQNVDKLLIVCTDEPTSLTDAYAFIKVVSAQSPQIDIQVVMNAMPTYEEGQQTYQTLLKACQSFLKISPSLAGIVRLDPHVKEAIRLQASILSVFPSTKASQDVLDLVRKMA